MQQLLNIRDEINQAAQTEADYAALQATYALAQGSLVALQSAYNAANAEILRLTALVPPSPITQGGAGLPLVSPNNAAEFASAIAAGNSIVQPPRIPLVYTGNIVGGSNLTILPGLNQKGGGITFTNAHDVRIMRPYIHDVGVMDCITIKNNCQRILVEDPILIGAGDGCMDVTSQSGEVRCTDIWLVGGYLSKGNSGALLSMRSDLYVRNTILNCRNRNPQADVDGFIDAENIISIASPDATAASIVVVVKASARGVNIRNSFLLNTRSDAALSNVLSTETGAKLYLSGVTSGNGLDLVGTVSGPLQP